jgi:hypothetical protein
MTRPDSNGSSPYVGATVSRSTTYVDKKGLPIFELTDSCGTVYTMQSYSQQVDPLLTCNKLKSLSSKLKLPVGWTYTVRRPKSDFDLVATGTTSVVQDIFANSYQINPSLSQTLPNCTPTQK